MSCPHAETTTVLWCYGEADEAHAAHVGACADCQAVVADHETVQAVVLPIAPALATAPPRRRLPAVVFAGLALAAAVLIGIGLGGPDRPPQAEPVAAVAPASLVDDAVDLQLDALALELDALTADPSLL